MTKRISIGTPDKFPAGRMTKVDADGTPILVTPVEGKFCATQSQCAHLPLPLAGGKLDGTMLTCPFHGSQYDVCTGENLDWTTGFLGLKMPKWSRGMIALGKKPQPLKTYLIVEENGELFVELPE